MSFQGHVTELTRRHRDLDRQIEAERSHPARDILKLGELKRKKLLLKDEIERLLH